VTRAAALLAVGTAAIGAAPASSTAPVLRLDESCYAPAGNPDWKQPTRLRTSGSRSSCGTSSAAATMRLLDVG